MISNFSLLDFINNFAYNFVMKKYLLTLICLCLFANTCMADFAIPKLSLKKNNNIDTSVSQAAATVKSEKKEAKPFFKKSAKPDTKVKPEPKKELTKKEAKSLFKKTAKPEVKVKPEPKKEVTKKETKPLFKKTDKPEVKVKPEPKKEVPKKEIKPLFKKTESKSIQEETSVKPEENAIELKTDENNTQKINIKNPFKKSEPVVGEDMVSKEQVKEELERVQNLSQQAVALYTDNNLDEALNTFLKIPEKYRTAQDNLLVGNILLDLGKPEDAVFMYKRAILADECFYKPYYNIGNICLNDDKYFMAIDYYKKAIRYAPDFPYAYYNLACAYIKAGELKKAKSNLVKAIELKKTDANFHYNLAYVYKKLNKPKQAQIYLDNYNKLTNGQ